MSLLFINSNLTVSPVFYLATLLSSCGFQEAAADWSLLLRTLIGFSPILEQIPKSKHHHFITAVYVPIIPIGPKGLL